MLQAHVQRLFSEYRFLPLPLGMNFSLNFSSLQIRRVFGFSAYESGLLHAIVKNPTLARAAVANGEQLISLQACLAVLTRVLLVCEGFSLSEAYSAYLLQCIDCPSGRLVQRGVVFPHKVPIEVSSHCLGSQYGHAKHH